MEEDWAEMLAECHNIIDQSVAELEHLSMEIDGEDTIEPVALHQLHDMAEDAAQTYRMRRAQTNLAWRQTGSGSA